VMRPFVVAALAMELWAGPLISQQAGNPPAQKVVLNAISPRSRSAQGGTKVSIAGTGFKKGATVGFGYVPASVGFRQAIDVQVVSDSTIVAVTPPHKPGKVDVVVTNPSGETAALTDAFEYR